MQLTGTLQIQKESADDFIDYAAFHASIAALRINHILITIETEAECKKGKAPPFEVTPKKEEPKTPPPLEKNAPPKTKEKAPPNSPSPVEDF
jgi:hypothetical protein